MNIAPDSSGWYAFEREVSPEAIRELAQLPLVEQLSLVRAPLLTVRLARRMACLRVEHFWLWCNVTRRAMRYIVEMPGLRRLDILSIRGPGQMANFGRAKNLEVFRANHYLTEADLFQVLQCGQLKELGAQGAELSRAAMSAMLALPHLTTLDLEATRFDDGMARQVSRSRSIVSLDIGGTKITRSGLEHLVQMEQLRSLDLWATAIQEADLPLLLNLPHLAYLSLGNVEWRPALDSSEVVRLILEAPSLKRVWLDGIMLEASQKAALEAKLDSLQLT